MTELQNRLFAMQDQKYRDFSSKLMPNVPKETVIGIRTPDLRRFAKGYAKELEAEAFLQALPHTYYEENNLHGMLIEQMKDYDRCVQALDAFLPYVDNWATCDLISPKVLGKQKQRLLTDIRRWIAQKSVYMVRFGLEMLMRYFLDEDFQPDYLSWAVIPTEEYYINMMAAWFFATALAKQYDAAVVYLERRRLSPWVHNKTIQKAVESYRVTEERKAYLRTLRWKQG